MFTVVFIVVNSMWAAEVLDFPIIKSIHLSINHFTFVFVSTDKLSVLPESSLGADKSSWRQNIPHRLSSSLLEFHKYIMQIQVRQVRRTTLTWDCVLAKGFGVFLNIPLNIPPVSWRISCTIITSEQPYMKLNKLNLIQFFSVWSEAAVRGTGRDLELYSALFWTADTCGFTSCFQHPQKQKHTLLVATTNIASELQNISIINSKEELNYCH